RRFAKGGRFAAGTVSVWGPSGDNAVRVGPLWGKPLRGQSAPRDTLREEDASRGYASRPGPFPGGTPLGTTCPCGTPLGKTASRGDRLAGHASRGGRFAGIRFA